MEELIFASNNNHKIAELQASIGSAIKLISLKEAGIDIDIEEPFNTILENASEKSRVIWTLTGKNCFSEDTGLEVEALNGAPGVHSARYAGESRDASLNTAKLLQEMAEQANRKARFRTVISLRLGNTEFIFEGLAEGTILTEAIGEMGFGYDPVFVPLGSKRSFAQMTIDEKAQYSHRRKAADKLVLFLRKHHLPGIYPVENENKTL